MKLYQRQKSAESPGLIPKDVHRDSFAWNGLDSELSDVLSRELQSLRNEKDSRLYSEGLLSFAQRAEQAGYVGAAMEAYRWLSERDQGSTGEAARSRLECLSGRGSFGERAEELTRHFAKEASDPASLMAMAAGGIVYRATRLAAMSRLAGCGGIWGRGAGLKLAGGLAGFAMEAPTFTLVGRLGRGRELGGEGLKEELLSSYLVLGGLKGMGALARQAGRGIGGPEATRWLGYAGMYGGIMLGHGLETAVGLREWESGGAMWVEGMATLLQFQVSGGLLARIGGARYAVLERQLERRAEHISEWSGIERAANDGGYGTGPRESRSASNPKEIAANGPHRAVYEQIWPLAAGAEWEVGKNIVGQTRKTANPDDRNRHLVFSSLVDDMPLADSENKGEVARVVSGLVTPSPAERLSLERNLSAGDDISVQVAGDIYGKNGDVRGELIHLEMRLRESAISSPEVIKIRRSIWKIQKQLLDAALGKDWRQIHFGWRHAAVTSVTLGDVDTAQASALFDYLAKKNEHGLFRIAKLHYTTGKQEPAEGLIDLIRQGYLKQLEVLDWRAPSHQQLLEVIGLVGDGSLPRIRKLRLFEYREGDESFLSEAVESFTRLLSEGKLAGIESLEVFEGWGPPFVESARQRYLSTVSSPKLPILIEIPAAPSEPSFTMKMEAFERRSAEGVGASIKRLSFSGLEPINLELLIEWIRLKRIPELDSLRLNYSVFGDAIMMQLGDLVREGGMKGLKEFSIEEHAMTGNFVTSRGFRSLFGAIGAGGLPNLEQLSLMGRSYSANYELQLQDLVLGLGRGKYPFLRSIQLEGLALAEGEVEYLMAALKAWGAGSLETLTLNGSGIENVDRRALLASLESGAFTGLRTLGLRETDWNADGVRRIARAIEAGKLPRLERLDLLYNGITDYHAGSLKGLAGEIGFRVEY